MPTSNPFCQLLDRSSPVDRVVLQLIHDLSSVTVDQLGTILSSLPRLELVRSLKILDGMGLVMKLEQLWVCTWLGVGVCNWRQQLHWCELMSNRPAVIPSPRLGENGQQLGPPCDEYRPVFFSPGSCWCGRERNEHFSVVFEVAMRLIRRE